MENRAGTHDRFAVFGPIIYTAVSAEGSELRKDRLYLLCGLNANMDIDPVYESYL